MGFTYLCKVLKPILHFFYHLQKQKQYICCIVRGATQEREWNR